MGRKFPLVLTTYPSLIFVALCAVTIVGGAFIIDEISKSTREWYWPNDPNSSRCEETDGNEANFLREPANAVSNAVFMLVGIYAFLCGIYDFRHFRGKPTFPLVPLRERQVNPSNAKGGLVNYPLVSVAFGVSMFFGGYGSFYYHACSGCAKGGQLDIWSIFVMVAAVAVLLNVFSIGNFLSGVLCSNSAFSGRNLGGKLWTVLCFCSWGAICLYCENWREPPIWQGSWEKMYQMLIYFLGLVAGVQFCFLLMLLCRGVKCTYHVFIPGAVAAVTMGVGAWFPEEINEECVDLFGGEFGEGRESFFQLHALWHAMLALCMLSLYMFVRGLAVEQETLDASLGNGRQNLFGFHFLKEIPSPRSQSFEERVKTASRGGSVSRNSNSSSRNDEGVGLELGHIELQERML
jgi:hypothetical protein